VVVRGRILFQTDAQVFSGATAYVTLEDTTYADAPAEPVSSWRRDDVAYPRDAAGIPFAIKLETALSSQRRYGLRVLIDVDGDGRLSHGDYLNTAAAPVSGEEPIEIRVQRLESA
jgi:hypothetical protein